MIAVGYVAGCSPSDDNANSTISKDSNVTDDNKNTIVVIQTSMGTIKAELWDSRAPKTVANFLRYIDEGFYDGLIFHRVIDGFMIQGGGFTSQMQQKTTHSPIANEASAELRNDRGTLAMARTNQVDSATSQFFINLVDNDSLNHTSRAPRGFGYCAFGEVIEGLDVVDKIAKSPTANQGSMGDVPVEQVQIISISRGGE